ncbi:hypothetical protein [Mesorhizobium captivum]|uniref:hypothetical protein n=1 Tax=Mesorhizobium captivum TaxID=3072319 RepID=UPI002A249829|nr:hypothetical protein [Mesorhizobium sp. VK3C]MDX8447049.1 hypothetical protein [Mesorhizobium sp. VK3C]
MASVLALAAASAAVAPTQAETIKTGKHRCRTKMVTHWVHHRKVVEKIKVCR